MASLFKKQILKHLSRFTKNLSPDKINLSTFKGEGELTSLELDEIVLTDLLELPSWVRVTSAWCNKVAFRIQWTRLKSVPIEIILDEVKVEIETCEELRSLSAQQGLSAYGAATKYSFINKVIDGMTISVNKVSITFRTPAFEASVDIMKILVESKSPEWKKEPLSKTMKKDLLKEQILIFKGLEWQALKLEAKSTKDSDLPPLRLLTVRSRCRLTIKKRISDCFVMGCKLLLILDELLWVLTDSQLKAVLHFVDSLSGLVQKANETTRIKKAARKLEMLPEYHAQISQQAQKETGFGILDVIETSYHFLAHKINLYLSDDPGAGRSFHSPLGDGGIVHLEIVSLQADYYPYHLAAANRSHWPRYGASRFPHVDWLTSAQTSFKNSLLNLIESGYQSTIANKGYDCSNAEENGIAESAASPSSIKKYVVSNLAKVMTSCIILRVEDFTVFRVTTHNKQVPKEFLKGDRRSVPPETSLVHAEFTYYYYPGDIAFPLPPPKFYVCVHPIVMNFDPNTILWLNSFALNLHHSLHSKPEPVSPLNYIDVRIEAILPKVVFESLIEPRCGQRDRPKSLHFQATRIWISNVRNPDWCSRADLAKCIHACQLGSLFFGTDFPSKPGDFNVIADKFIDHAQCEDNVRNPVGSLPVRSVQELVSKLSKTLLWVEARDIWCVYLDPVYGEFQGARGVAQNRSVPFIDAFQLKIWAYLNVSDLPLKKESKPSPKIHALANLSNLVSAQLNHYQLLFLLRLSDEITEVVTILELDAHRITKKESGGIVVGAVLPQLELNLVMPSPTPGKESSVADLESVIPDSSSLADDIVTNPSIQWNAVLSTNLQDGGVYKRDNSLTATSPPSDRVSIDAFPSPRVDSPLKTWNNIIGFSSMKKGFTNITNLIDKIKEDDISETFSTRSDDSSDSDNFVLRPGINDVIFHGELPDTVLGNIDYGCEAVEDCDDQSGATLSITTPSENPSNTSLYKRRDLICIATFKLGQVEFVQQSEGLSSTIKVHVSNVAIEECPVIPWDEFQTKFSTRSRGWSEVGDYTIVKPRIKLRKDHFVKSGDSTLWTGTKNTPAFDDLVEVMLSNINVVMTSGTVSSIAEFFVDDIPSPPLPLKATIENVVVHLTEDRTESIVGPSTPINMKISRLRLSRNSDGVFVIEPTVPQEPSSQEVNDLKSENEDLRRRLAAIERLNEENHRLRKCEEEAIELRSQLHETQERLGSILNDHQSLIEEMKSLQLNQGDGRHQSSGKR